MAQEILSNNPVGQEVMKEMEILDQIQKDINVQSEVLKAVCISIHNSFDNPPFIIILFIFTE